MGSNYSLEYGVDMAFCIDATASMRPVLDMVKENALNFYQDLTRYMAKKGKYIKQLRIRVIAFRDYLADEEPMLVTPFFSLPDQAEDFAAVVRSIQPLGGGDPPEDGLEALGYAMKSKWDNSFQLSRHVIVVWTDDATHPLGYGKKAGNYPQKMAANFQELSDWWGYGAYSPGAVMDQRAKRLVLFTPDLESWNTIRDTWNQVIHIESEAGQGVRDVDYETMMSIVAESISSNF